MHIYAITNTVNDKIYVGQHAGDSLPAYLAYNIRAALAGRGNKLFLYRAIRKYGPEAFVIKSLAQPLDKEQMDRLEIFFIRVLETQNDTIGYNITAGGGGRLGVKRPHTQEEKNRIGDAIRGRVVTWGNKISAAQKGRTFTPEHVAALRAGQKGKKKRRSPEHSRKISENKKKWWADKKAKEAACLMSQP
jgi:group I intron endonuclease